MRFFDMRGPAMLVLGGGIVFAQLVPPAGASLLVAPAQTELVLTEEQRAIIANNVRQFGGSTLGLGALAEGADVPRGVALASFPKRVVDFLPQMGAYRYFALENVIAIVDPRSLKVLLVIEQTQWP